MDTAEGTSHDMIQTGVVFLMCGIEEVIMVTVTKKIVSEKEPLVFMERAENNRRVLLQCRKRTEIHSHG